MSIHAIAIIGAGTQGRLIAQILLRGGYRVVLEDFSIRTLEEAEASIRHIFAKHEVSEHFSTCIGVEDAIRDANLIIETAADELETKLELFTIFDKFARPDAIFASTSVAHPIAEIADITACPERCVTLRFAPIIDNPTSLIVIAGPQTSTDTFERCADFARRLKLQVSQPPLCSEK